MVDVERGLFIVLEGIDNCGKTTQSDLLRQYFENKGLPVIPTREPGGTEVGEEIRGILLKGRAKMLDPLTQTLLFFASRTEFIKNVVQPNIQRGVNVISDRFIASTYVYQGYVQEVDRGFIDSLYNTVVRQKGTSPDAYIILDIPAEESFRRDSNADNQDQALIYEKQGLDFREKLRQGYLEFATANRVLIVLIDGTQDRDAIHRQVVKVVEDALERRSQLMQQHTKGES